jgi:hypothetical protein
MLGISAHAEVHPKPSNSPSAAASGAESNTALKAAVVNSQSQLGVLDPVQKRIFDEEVVPQYPLFVRDYKRVGQEQTIDAQVDLDAIRNTIRFSAQKYLNQPAAKFLLFLNADTQCSKCMEEAASVKKSMQLRAQRRGFTPVWVSAEELAGSSLSDLIGPRGAVGFLQIDLIPEPADDVDTAHSDEKHYLAKANFEVHAIATYRDQGELFETDSFEAESQKLLTHAFSELGAKADMAGIGNAAKDDILVELGNITGFIQYTRLKNTIQTRLKGVALVDERKLSRGHASFALKTKKSIDEVKALLNGIASGEDQAIQMEIK